jgi:hypothetical protein
MADFILQTRTAGGLMTILERKAGRILVNGWSTEATHTMVYGGTFPFTSDGRTTSVRTLAIRRFLQPVYYHAITAACCRWHTRRKSLADRRSAHSAAEWVVRRRRR